MGDRAFAGFIKVGFGLFILWALLGRGFESGLGGCLGSRNAQTIVQIQNKQSAADGLDLKAVGALVPKVRNAKELEEKLNAPGGINNLDLNQDGKVDYIKVSEFGDDKVKGFSLTTEPVAGEIQEIASIEIQKKMVTRPITRCRAINKCMARIIIIPAPPC